MKKETYQAKLAKLLGMAPPPEESKKNLNVAVSVPEANIQEFRAMQGVVYFLQAPELFTPKVCTHCGESFLVSRQYVKCCSYTCIRMELREAGIEWSKGHDLEALANDPNVYEGNEPIWIRNLDRLRAVLDKLAEPEAEPALELVTV